MAENFGVENERHKDRNDWELVSDYVPQCTQGVTVSLAPSCQIDIPIYDSLDLGLSYSIDVPKIVFFKIVELSSARPPYAWTYLDNLDTGQELLDRAGSSVLCPGESLVAI